MNINDGVPSITYQMIQIPPQPLNIFNYGVPHRKHHKARVEKVFFEGNVFDNHVVGDERAYRIIHRIGQSATKRPELYHLTVKYETCLFILDKTHLFLVIKYFNRDLSGTAYSIPSFCQQLVCYFNLLLWQILPQFIGW